jgi:hypothetical protein
MPGALNLSSAAIVPYGLYLLDDGVNQFLYVSHCSQSKHRELTITDGLVVTQYQHSSRMSLAWRTVHNSSKAKCLYRYWTTNIPSAYELVSRIQPVGTFTVCLPEHSRGEVEGSQV